MKSPFLIKCEFYQDSFCALWLDHEGDYILGWIVGMSAAGNSPAASSKLRYKDRVQVAEAYRLKCTELIEIAR